MSARCPQTTRLAHDLDAVLAATRDVWEPLRGKRIFLTGGTAFFGSWLLESFTHACDALRLDAEIVVLTRSPARFEAKAAHLARHPNIRLYEGNVRDFQFPGGPFSHIIHGATVSGLDPDYDRPLEVLETTIGGTRRTLEFARECGARRFLLLSSGAVYGEQPATLERVPETYNGAPDPLNPRSAYGQAKRVAELLASIYTRQYGLEAVIARCFSFIGPYMPLDGPLAIGNFIRDQLSGQPIVMRGDGTPRRAYLYAADLVVWLWRLLIRGVPGRAYNVGSEQSISMRELAALVARVLGGPALVSAANASQPLGGAWYVPSTSRAREELGLIPSVDLEEAIRRTAEWARAAAGRGDPS